MSVAQQIGSVVAAKRRTGGRPPGAPILALLPERLRLALTRTGWALASIGLFACLWELLWAVGLADPRLLPPPHIFLGNFPDQLKFFNTAQRWQIGVGQSGGPTPFEALLYTVASSAMRVLAGLLIASALSI